jgi:hypothetical protein
MSSLKYTPRPEVTGEREETMLIEKDKESSSSTASFSGKRRSKESSIHL